MYLIPRSHSHSRTYKFPRSMVSQTDLAQYWFGNPRSTNENTHFYLLTVWAAIMSQVLYQPGCCVRIHYYYLNLRLDDGGDTLSPCLIEFAQARLSRQTSRLQILYVAGTVCQRHDWNPNWFTTDFPRKRTHAPRAATKTRARADWKITDQWSD